jgi:hypothetical protein
MVIFLFPCNTSSPYSFPSTNSSFSLYSYLYPPYVPTKPFGIISILASVSKRDKEKQQIAVCENLDCENGDFYVHFDGNASYSEIHNFICVKKTEQ